MQRGVSITLALLTKNWRRGVREVTGDLDGIGAKARGVATRLGRHAGMAMDRIAMAGTAAAGVGLGLFIRQQQQLELRMTRAALTARQEADQIDRLRDKLFSLSGAPTGQTADELLTAVEELIALDVSWEDVLGTDMLDQLGRTATATGADIGDLAKMAYTLGNAYKLNSGEIGDALEVLANAGKRGAFLFPEMSAELPQIAAAMAQINQTGPKGLARTAAMMQIVRRETGSSAVAATNLINALSYLQSPEFNRKGSKAGIEVFDDTGKMRDLFLVLDDLNRVTEKGANQELLAQLFTDRQAREGIAALVRHGEDLVGLVNTLETSGGVIDSDFAAISDTDTQGWKNLRSEVEKLANLHLGPWADQLGDLLKTINDNPWMLDDMIKAAGAVYAASVGRRAVMGVAGLVMGAKSGGAAGAVTGAVGGATAMPVFVTNWPPGAMVPGGGVPGKVPPVVPGVRPPVKLGLGARMAGKLGFLAGAPGMAALGNVAAAGGTAVGAAGAGSIAAAVGAGALIAGGQYALNQLMAKITGWDPQKLWENTMTSIGAWFGNDDLQRLRNVRRDERQHFKEEELRIKIEVTDPDERKAELKELRRLKRSHSS